MALIVEDGTGKADAQSYVTVAEATTYHSMMDNTDWASNPTLQESCLVKATQMIDLLWGQKFLSRKRNRIQTLLYPRLGFYDNNADYVYDNEIPKSLKVATYELALQFITAGDNNLLENDFTLGIKKSLQKLGDVWDETEYTGAPSNSPKLLRLGYTKIDLILSVITSGPNFSIRL